jgi:acyl-CoA synthetase (NDP forming)
MDVRRLPRTPDVGIICALAEQVPNLVHDCGQAGILGLIIISSGFREAGPEGRALEDRILAEARHFEGLRIIGPNCLGLISPGRQWGVRKVMAITTNDNPRMVAVFEKRGFRVEKDLEDSLAEVSIDF